MSFIDKSKKKIQETVTSTTGTLQQMNSNETNQEKIRESMRLLQEKGVLMYEVLEYFREIIFTYYSINGRDGIYSIPFHGLIKQIQDGNFNIYFPDSPPQNPGDDVVQDVFLP